MKYQCKIWNPDDTAPKDEDFLSSECKQYLAGCGDEIFKDWDQHFPSEKSLAGVLTRTVLDQLSKPGFALDPFWSSGYRTAKAFHHQKSTSDLWVDIFDHFNHHGLSDFLVATQTVGFKEKFLYDSATMTIDSLTNHYANFLRSLELTRRPRLFLIAFDDLGFGRDVLVRGKQKFVRLLRT